MLMDNSVAEGDMSLTAAMAPVPVMTDAQAPADQSVLALM